MLKPTLITAAVASILLTSATLSAGPHCGMNKQGQNMRMGHNAGYHYGMGYQKPAYAAPMQAMHSVPADIVDTAVAAGSFNTLVTAVKEAGLVEVLKGEGPFTVFAPTDAAFAKLPAGTLDGLLKDKAKLTQILTYHVVPGRVDSSAVKGIAKLATVEGSELPVAEIKISQTDIETSNGVIHVIDEVLIPQS